MTPEQLGITKDQYENLSKLADLLETVDRHSFDMKHYVVAADNEYDTFAPYAAHNADCGTVACAAGHLATIVKPLKDEGWIEFLDRVTGIDGALDWYWLFDGNWVRTDNTALGASKRIRYFLDNGAPSNVYAQMRGDAPLCY